MDMNELRAACQDCKKCPLWEKRTNVVFGEGNPSAEVMFVGEGPGEQEDKTGHAFVGPAGKFLDDMLSLIDIDRKNVYIANIVKCRPPQNREPLGLEREACLPWLREQTKLLSPKIIVCLGPIAACSIIREDFKITREHGQWTEKGGVKMMAIYHPSALLRDSGLRPETFVDLKSLQGMIKELCPNTFKS